MLGLTIYITKNINNEDQWAITFLIIFISLAFISAMSCIEGYFEDRLYQTICSKSQKEMRQVTCEKIGIEVTFDNGDIEYSFPDLKKQDSNSTQ